MARVCIIRQNYFPLDPRVRREAEALEALGHEVDVVCLRRDGEPRRERRGLITVHRLPLSHAEGSRVRYVIEYGVFMVAATIVLTLLHLRRRYDLIQVNSMPDALVFAAVGPRLLGRASVLLDLHECMPEFLATKYGLDAGHPAVRLLSLAEQMSIGFADTAVTCTEQMRETFIGRGARPEKLKVVLNAADEATFDPTRYPTAARDPKRLVLICHGSVERLYGLDTVLRAVALVKQEGLDVQVQIFGEGSFLDELRRLATELELGEAAYFSGEFVPLPELLAAISAADVGVVATRSDAFRDLTHCNKMYDFVAMDKPLICSRTRAVEAYFDDGCFQYFQPSDERDLARAIRELYHDPVLAQRIARRAAEVCEPYRWKHQRSAYQVIASDLITA